MGNTVMLAISFPLVIVGMVLVIMWGMNAAESPRKRYDQGESERMPSREV